MSGYRISGALRAAALSIATGACLAVGLAKAWKTEAVAWTAPRGAPTPMRSFFEASLDSLTAAVDALGVAIADPERHARLDAFRRARGAYKRAEFLLAYYSPTTVAAVNGPADSDDPDGPPAPLGSRAGFGALETDIFGDSSETPTGVEAHRIVASMLASLRALRGATPLLTVNDTSALDAMRLELTRVMTMGIEGYDSDESGGAMFESAAALQGIVDGLAQLTTTTHGTERTHAIALVERAARTLRSAPDFGAFDRFGFISTAGVPAAAAITALRHAVDSRPRASRRLWRPSAATPFDSDAFDLSALAPEYAPRPSPEVLATGRRLFFDPRLSGPGTRSCASCHIPTKSFTDGRRRAAPLGNTPTLLRNTPTLVNAALQPAMFADERAGFVEDQIRVVLSSPAEMASSPELAAARTGLDERTVRVALAAYIRTLTGLNSRFDRAIRGDTTALTTDERHGFNLFAGKARCGTCHFAPLFGGTLPPEFTRSELEIVGVPSSAATKRATIDPDSGRERVDHWREHRFAFRVPTIRNAALTAPYMHNGVYATLEQVVDFYDRGGGAGIGAPVPAQTLPSRPLHLTPRERSDLVAFIRSVTDSSASVAKP